MADDILQSGGSGDQALDSDVLFDFWTIDPRLTALNDQTLTSQNGSPLPSWNDQIPIEQTQINNGSPNYGLSLEGSACTDLATRSNTPGSDSGQYASSPGLGSGIAQLNASAYRSRLPRRRSLYSRPKSSMRKSAMPASINEPLWMPEDSHAVETAGAFEMNTPGDHAPLRRSDSSTSIASVGSECSNSSAYSTASASSATSTSRRNSSSHRRQRKKTLSSSSSRKADPDARPFKCTFCCDAFKSKYDWRRHEKSLHLDLEVYRCAPPDGTVLCPDSLGRRCAYCHFSNPDQTHLETHNHIACASRATAARSFRRRDHLAQHLRVFHKLQTLPQLDDNWVDQVPPVTSRCGFCNSRLSSWEERADHLAAHFRQGTTMRDWQGGHGFDDNISARLTNAVPPYYIATEAQSLVPFSATSADSKDHFAQISAGVFQHHNHQKENLTSQTPAPVYEEQNQPINPQTPPVATTATDIPPAPEPQQPANTATSTLLDSRALTASAFADILASHLARFALEYKALGIRASDEMLQREARQVLYSSDDPWNQTIADIPLWLQEFRERHGLE
ncbi:hypothetical protein Q7P37_009454 [Cladosporium fusiforme]